MIIDTHAHLYYPELLENLDEVISRAKDAGIQKIIVPAVDLATSEQIIRLSEKYEIIYCALGIHPCDAGKNDIRDIDKIEKLLNHEKVLAIGETGLDYYWDTSTALKQKEFFKLQIELAKSYNLPVVIHTRNSVDDAIEIIKEKHDENLSGQFHCFSGNIGQLKTILDLSNFYVSFCGNITYKNYKETEIISECPVDRILSETDSPFLTPVPYRGKKNEPSHIVNTLRKISEIKNFGYDELLGIVYMNVFNLFRKLK